MDRETAENRQARLDWAVKIALEAGRVTLQHFRHSGLQVERKSDDSPVTVADRQAEELLRKRIAERFPEDGILGEEMGLVEGKSQFQWILDPIDGTKSFIHGVPLYTTLVAVLEAQKPCAGVIHAPATAETVYARTGGGCWYVTGEGEAAKPARVSPVRRLKEGLLLTSEVSGFGERRGGDATEVYLKLQRAARLARTWGDGYGYLMVATGRAEVMIDPVMSLWDTAALATVIEEAGGRFSDWQGEPTIFSGDALATNGLVADDVLALTKGH